MTECLQIFLTSRLENAQEEASAEHALFKWLVSGDNLETAIVVVAVGKFANTLSFTTNILEFT